MLDPIARLTWSAILNALLIHRSTSNLICITNYAHYIIFIFLWFGFRLFQVNNLTPEKRLSKCALLVWSPAIIKQASHSSLVHGLPTLYWLTTGYSLPSIEDHSREIHTKPTKACFHNISLIIFDLYYSGYIEANEYTEKKKHNIALSDLAHWVYFMPIFAAYKLLHAWCRNCELYQWLNNILHLVEPITLLLNILWRGKTL